MCVRGNLSLAESYSSCSSLLSWAVSQCEVSFIVKHFYHTGQSQRSWTGVNKEGDHRGLKSWTVRVCVCVFEEVHMCTQYTCINKKVLFRSCVLLEVSEEAHCRLESGNLWQTLNTTAPGNREQSVWNEVTRPRFSDCAAFHVTSDPCEEEVSWFWPFSE